MKNIFIFLLVAFSLAFSGYVFFNAGEDSQAISTGSAVFTSSENLFHDWGDINIVGGDVRHTFTLTNTQDKPILLQGAATSCMCTTAEIILKDGSKSGEFGMHGGPDWEQYIRPGESFDVEVVFDPMAHGPNATGSIARMVNVIGKLDRRQKAVQYTRIDVSGEVLSESDYQAKYES